MAGYCRAFSIWTRMSVLEEAPHPDDRFRTRRRPGAHRQPIGAASRALASTPGARPQRPDRSVDGGDTTAGPRRLHGPGENLDGVSEGRALTSPPRAGHSRLPVGSRDLALRPTAGHGASGPGTGPEH